MKHVCIQERRPLKQLQIFEDISQDHARKTATFETFPHLNNSFVTIHPCKHASVMKKIIENMEESLPESEKKSGGIRVDQYLMVFLKFMSCAMPTMDYDHTAAVKTTK